MKYILAIDIGASSGRHIIGYLEDGQIKTKEIFRFKNDITIENNHLVWDINYLFDEVKKGIKIAFSLYQEIESLSIDTWGVDYVLLDENDEVIYPVYAYRDLRTNEIIDEVNKILSKEELYNITGSQFQTFNTIYQMYYDKTYNRLDKASSYLMIPEYLMYKLTGKKVHEYTNASTTGILDLKTKTFSDEIITSLGLKKSLFTNLVKPGHVIGDFTEEVKNEVGGNTKVKLCATHDTASAIEALDISDDSIYISSGTWSLLGVKLNQGINNIDAYKANYSNEYGPNYIRFLKNIMGLWIIQGLNKELNISFEEMSLLAKESNYNYIFDCNDESFLSSLNIKESIINWYKKHNMPIPKEDKDFIFASYNSLAYSYKEAIIELEKITNKTYNSIYIVGGGAKSLILNELTKKYTNKNVYALPIEATSIGNIKCQMRKYNESKSNRDL